MHHLNSDINTSLDKIYLLKHKLLSNVVKLSISQQPKSEFIANLSNNQNPLVQFTFFSKIKCNNPSYVYEKVQQALKTHLAIGDLYDMSPKDALKIARREAFRIPVVHRD